ncbi:hypothetical protein AQUCO_02700365v1 [Aquilegia coerulea]|uniref:F-box domain-containing protein n=1 Tax=Aquilegia coerulea TaxID=218851 RepID=A0A2G5D7F0_AQUCA|nr:hypothetical protein AQUCO_02700365v1 [Aquilegia coerulea]
MVVNNNDKKRRRIYAKDDNEEVKQQQVVLSNKLADDIMFEILSRLPAESLIRFRFVSKSWNNLIKKDHIFINMHLVRAQIQQQSNIMLKVHYTYRIYSLDYQNSWPLQKLNQRLFGGLSSYGFGYNCITNDYVVLELTCSFRHLKKNQFRSTVAIYSLRNNLWRRIRNIPYQAISHRSGQLVNASLHWVAYSKPPTIPNDMDVEDRVLIAFEISSEKIRELPLPDLVFHEDKDWAVNEFQGKLCIFRTTGNRMMLQYFDMWVMENYGVKESWTKVFNIQKPPLFFSRDVLCTTKLGRFYSNEIGTT